MKQKDNWGRPYRPFGKTDTIGAVILVVVAVAALAAAEIALGWLAYWLGSRLPVVWG